MEGPPLGPGGEDITWPDQVAPRGRKASSTRKIKPQTSNLIVPLDYLIVPLDYHSSHHCPSDGADFVTVDLCRCPQCACPCACASACLNPCHCPSLFVVPITEPRCLSTAIQTLTPRYAQPFSYHPKRCYANTRMFSLHPSHSVESHRSEHPETLFPCLGFRGRLIWHGNHIKSNRFYALSIL